MLLLDISGLLIDYGYTGMGVAAFLAGSVVPFSSEAVLTALYAGGLNLWTLVVASTIGNVLGGVFNYFIGRLCNEGWVYRLFRIKPEKLDSTKERVRKYGAWTGLFSSIPIVGDAITLALGILRVNFTTSLLAMFVGKAVRYAALALILGSL
jgi:membrane protein YqaA with SNARE-associated domain